MCKLHVFTVLNVLVGVSALVSGCGMRSGVSADKAEERQIPISPGPAEIPISPEEEKHLDEIWARAGKAIAKTETGSDSKRALTPEVLGDWETLGDMAVWYGIQRMRATPLQELDALPSAHDAARGWDMAMSVRECTEVPILLALKGSTLTVGQMNVVMGLVWRRFEDRQSGALRQAVVACLDDRRRCGAIRNTGGETESYPQRICDCAYSILMSMYRCEPNQDFPPSLYMPDADKDKVIHRLKQRIEEEEQKKR